MYIVTFVTVAFKFMILLLCNVLQCPNTCIVLTRQLQETSFYTYLLLGQFSPQVCDVLTLLGGYCVYIY